MLIPLSPSRTHNLPTNSSNTYNKTIHIPPAPVSLAAAANGLTQSIHDENVGPSPVEGYRKPRKRRKVEKEDDISTFSDVHVWDRSDEDIIAASQKKWTSDVYDHYNISIRRHAPPDGPKTILFVFSCKFLDPEHRPHERKREKTSDGTANLRSGFLQCIGRVSGRDHRVVVPSSSDPPDSYSEARHRAIIALRCAVYKRSFHSIDDSLYRWEVELLRPGTTLPSITTLSRDVHRLYEHLAPHITVYFNTRKREIHVVIDGWTSPINTENLGIVLVWEDGGKLLRGTLEFVELDQSHTGEYLASMLAACLNRFGISKYVRMLQMDNAGNCNTTAASLSAHIPHFLGMKSRPRCFGHVLHIISGSISIFLKKEYTRKKKVKGVDGNELDIVDEDGIADAPADAEEEEIAAIMDEEETEAEKAATVSGSSASSVRSKKVHDRKTVMTQREKAEKAAKAALGIEISIEERKNAQQLLPKMFSLSKKTADVQNVKNAWATKVKVHPPDGENLNATTLARQCPTRWGTEYKVVKSHLDFKSAVVSLMQDKNLKLSAFKLNDAQWELADWLVDILYYLYVPTLRFQDGSEPLIFEVLPTLERLIRSLKAASEDIKMPTVCRVACYSGMMMAEKYFALCLECEAYEISIVLCPNKKLAAFEHRGPLEVERIKQLVISRFDADYRSNTTPSDATSSSTTSSSQRHRQRRTWGEEPIPTELVFPTDDIRTYLQEPRVVLSENYNVLQYWNSQLSIRPSLARFGLAFCSIPATVCDGERAFSEGRNQINWNQHKMAQDTFQAQMGLGSWFGAPWFDLDVCEQIITKYGGPLRATEESEKT